MDPISGVVERVASNRYRRSVESLEDRLQDAKHEAHERAFSDLNVKVSLIVESRSDRRAQGAARAV